MKRFIFSIILTVIFGGSAVLAEDINIYNTGDTPYEIDCDLAISEFGTSVFLYDDGGTDDYQTNQSYTMTLHSNNGGAIYIKFVRFMLAQGTLMSIRDDLSGRMLVSNASGTSLVGMIFTSYESITIIWQSGDMADAGFKARVWCGAACQRFATNISVNGIEPTIVGSETYYDVYSGGYVEFHAENDFYEQEVHGYTQTDDNLIYLWYGINSSNDTTIDISGYYQEWISFSENGYYSVICIAQDQRGCYSRNLNNINIRVFAEPSWMDTTAVCGNFTMVNAGISGYSDFTWHAEEPGSTVGTFEDEHSPTMVYTAGSYGVVKLYYDANIGGEIVSDTLYVDFVAPPEPTTTDGVDTVCGYTAELQVFNTNPANEGRWWAYDEHGNTSDNTSVIYTNYDNPAEVGSDTYPHCYVTVEIPEGQTEVEWTFVWSEVAINPLLTESCEVSVDKDIVFRKESEVSVHQCGSASNYMTMCGNNTVELCADVSASAGYNSYMWQCNDIEGIFSDPTSNQTTFTPSSDVQISPYRDVDIYFTAIGICTAMDTMHVRFLQKPIANAGVDDEVYGNNYELNGTWSIPPSDNYTPTCQWSVGTKPNPDAQVIWANIPPDSIIEGVQVRGYGVYTFIVSEINTAGNDLSCYDRDTVSIEFLESVGIEENDFSGIIIFPNPANDILNITSSETISEIEIVNVMGQVVYRRKVNANNTVCDVERLVNGVYIVRIYGPEMASVICQRKFIKE